MNDQEVRMREKLEEQFDLLSKASKECEPKDLESITDAMLSIYTTIYPFV